MSRSSLKEESMTGSGFTDANNQRVGVGDIVEYEAKPGKLYRVTDVTQDGDVQIESKKGKVRTVKWRSVCKAETRIHR